MSGSLLDIAETVRDLGRAQVGGEVGPVSVRHEESGVALTVHVPRTSFDEYSLGDIAAALATLIRSRAIALIDPWAMPLPSLRALTERLCQRKGWAVPYTGRGSSVVLAIAARGDEREVYLLAPSDAVAFDPAAALQAALPSVAFANLVSRVDRVTYQVIARSALPGVPDPLTPSVLREALLEAGLQVDDLVDPWLAELRDQAGQNRLLNEELAGREHALKRVERDLAEARASIQRDERSLAGRRFAEYFRHKVKNPLAALKIDAALIAGRPLDEWDDNFRHVLGRAAKRVSAAAGRIVDMIDGLDRSGGSLVADLCGATGADVADLARRVAVTATVPVEVAEPDPAVSAARLRLDPSMLEDVFEELFANAGHHRRPGHPLQVTVEFKLEGDPAKLTCRIRDTGRGVPDDVRPRIFDHSFTTRADGTGRGLAICRTYVEDLGGRIAEEGSTVGAVFVIRLPLTEHEGEGR